MGHGALLGGAAGQQHGALGTIAGVPGCGTCRPHCVLLLPPFCGKLAKSPPSCGPYCPMVTWAPQAGPSMLQHVREQLVD